MLGVAFSIDEMAMHFKGNSAHKLRMTHKAEVDELQADALCQK